LDFTETAPANGWAPWTGQEFAQTV
jgi:hypothetical protein